MIEVMLRAIKKQCPTGVIATLMTDDCKIITSIAVYIILHNIVSAQHYLESMLAKECPGVTHLLCRWHVDRYVTLLALI